MSQDREAFLSRWSRRKVEAREPADDAPAQTPAVAPAPAGEKAPPPELPKIEDLTPESDFRPFMGAQVDPGTRRAALKKLFAHPQFNVPDPYEAYSEDYTVGEAIPAEMLKTLNQARKLLFDETAESAPEQARAEPAQEVPGEAPLEAKDAAGRQDA